MFFVVVVVVVDDLGYSNVGTGCVVGVAWVVRVLQVCGYLV